MTTTSYSSGRVHSARISYFWIFIASINLWSKLFQRDSTCSYLLEITIWTSIEDISKKHNGLIGLDFPSRFIWWSSKKVQFRKFENFPHFFIAWYQPFCKYHIVEVSGEILNFHSLPEDAERGNSCNTVPGNATITRAMFIRHQSFCARSSRDLQKSQLDFCTVVDESCVAIYCCCSSNPFRNPATCGYLQIQCASYCSLSIPCEQD